MFKRSLLAWLLLAVVAGCANEQVDDPGPAIDPQAIDPDLRSWSSEDHLLFLAECLQDHGFIAEIDLRDRSIAVGPPEQSEAASRAMEDCMQAAIDQGVVVGPPEISDENLRVWYAAYQITQSCLIEHGYPVVDPPSLDSYVEARGTNWHPYDAVPEASMYGEPDLSDTDGELHRGAEIRETCTADVTRLLPNLEGEDGQP